MTACIIYKTLSQASAYDSKILFYIIIVYYYCIYYSFSGYSLRCDEDSLLKFYLDVESNSYETYGLIPGYNYECTLNGYTYILGGSYKASGPRTSVSFTTLGGKFFGRYLVKQHLEVL